MDYDAEGFEAANLSSDAVPAIYRDAWVHLNRNKPLRFSEAAWLRASDDGARFRDTWGWVVESGWAWTPSELFDNNGDDKLGGLVWRLQCRSVVSYGPDYARLSDDVFIWRAEV